MKKNLLIVFHLVFGQSFHDPFLLGKISYNFDLNNNFLILNENISFKDLYF